MGETREDILIKYLRRRIADLNSKISKITYYFEDGGIISKSDIYRVFACGNESDYWNNSYSLNLYREIREDMSNRRSPMSPYNYFDLDTLISFRAYLSYILDKTFELKRNAGRKYCTSKDFSTAINHYGPEFLEDYANAEESGYYDLEYPIECLRDKYGNLKCGATMPKTNFDKKYNYDDCEKFLMDYLWDKHVRPKYKKEPDESLESSDNSESEVIEYKGIKYYVGRKTNFLTFDSEPIWYVEAMSEKCEVLKGFFDMDMNKYYGDVYDLDGNLYCDQSQSGLYDYKDDGQDMV